MPSELLLRHDPLPWWIDATISHVKAPALDALPWKNVFQEMDQLVAGAIANTDEKRQVGHYWLRDPMLAPTMGQARDIGDCLEQIRGFVNEVTQGIALNEAGERFTDVLHIGIGGSALGPQLLIQTCPNDGLRVWFLDNIDPDGIARILNEMGDRLRTTLILVASKSGTTPEPMYSLALVLDRLHQLNLPVGPRLVALTTPGSLLHKRAKKEHWREIFPLWDWVGGRVSVTSAVGLVPAGLAGVDIDQVLAGARAMDEWTATPEWRDNPAALLAGCWHVLGNGKGDRNLVVMPYSDRLLCLSRYLQQLVMESVGKKLDRDGKVVKQGLTVFGNKGSTDQHAHVQQLRDGRNDFMALFVQVLDDGIGSNAIVADDCNAGDVLQGFLLGTRRALQEGGRPSLVLTIATADAFAIGGLVALFERAVGLYGSLLNVNAYNQPGVEAGKVAAKEVLHLSRRVRELIGKASISAAALAKTLDADEVEVMYLCERLVSTRRLFRENTVPARYRLPLGHER
ncbi:MAG: glucose-6-phosphate isomerase [Rhodobacterales bacterium]|nr:glucose-6-phosphate isomerase [Rhodobacterales bacterium]